MAMLFAATYPQRTTALVLYGTYAKRSDPDEDYPWAATWAERQEYAREVERMWESDADVSRMSPGADEALARWWAVRARAAASPGAARDLILMNSQIDVRAVLPSIRVPTLVLHRRGDHDSRPEEGRYIAERIEGARFVELSGAEHVPWVDADQILDEVEEFLTGVRRASEPDRVLATVLFTDIVGSTERAAALGDRAWLELREAHHAAVRRLLEQYRGNEVETAGDSFLATFDGPARAVRCAREIAKAVGDLGLEVRAGVHTGECEVVEGKLGGIAVHIGARIAARARAGEVLVSRTVTDLVAGSGIVFEDRGAAALKGVPGEWPLYAAADASRVSP
jgi:class 3 adenylate cyclase